ncbi:MAG: 50S ribosomal protein L19e [Candidatus Korarchaeota archaeon NZ13-K]|nr:MAG: 50S ribosomal protein L19e [Candidatus Korarchaeota archaeon NZ13-K]
MDLEYQKRLAAKVAGVGLDRVRINPEKVEMVSEAVTRDDIRRLIRSGAIEILQKRGVSRARARARRRRRGPGSRKGGKYSRLSRKERWVKRIRALRRELRRMRDEGVIDAKTYRELYRRLSTFGSVSQLRAHVARG